MSDRAAQLRTLATSFYRELMRLADEMDAGIVLPPIETINLGVLSSVERFIAANPLTDDDPAVQAYDHSLSRPFLVPRSKHGAPAMDPALDC